LCCIYLNDDELDATWSKADPSKTLGKNSRFGKVESFLEMGGFPSIQPFSLYGPPVSGILSVIQVLT